MPHNIHSSRIFLAFLGMCDSPLAMFDRFLGHKNWDFWLSFKVEVELADVGRLCAGLFFVGDPRDCFPGSEMGFVDGIFGDVAQKIHGNSRILMELQ